MVKRINKIEHNEVLVIQYFTMADAEWELEGLTPTDGTTAGDGWYWRIGDANEAISPLTCMGDIHGPFKTIALAAADVAGE